MSEPKTAAVYTSAVNGEEPFIAHSPVWAVVVRGFQVFFSFVILVLSGLLIHGLALSPIVFALVCGLFSFIVVIYALVTEKSTECQRAYNIWAILALDLFMVIFWLSSMGANAALRAGFIYAVDADCYDDGSAVNAGHCVVYKRSGMVKRGAVATKAGLAEMSAVAGLSALVMLLFLATLIRNGRAYHMHYRAKKAHADNGTVEMNPQYGQAQGLTGQQPVVGAQVQQQYSDQQQYAAQPVYDHQAQYQQPQQVYNNAYPDQQQQQPYNNYGAPVQ